MNIYFHLDEHFTNKMAEKDGGIFSDQDGGGKVGLIALTNDYK